MNAERIRTMVSDTKDINRGLNLLLARQLYWRGFSLSIASKPFSLRQRVGWWTMRLALWLSPGMSL